MSNISKGYGTVFRTEKQVKSTNVNINRIIFHYLSESID